MKYLFLVMFCCIAGSTGAQNLVVNHSFEDKIACPETFGSFPLPSEDVVSAINWYRATEGSSDYFNACVPGSPDISVPENFAGIQQAHTGIAYGGGYTLNNPQPDFDYREYLETRLQEPMQAGHEYFVSFWVNLAAWNNESSYRVTAQDRLGIYLSADSVAYPEEPSLLDYLEPQIESEPGRLLKDTAFWENITGLYFAEGGEEWLTTGSFQPYDSIQTEVVSGAENSVSISYYYYDDFCVLDLSERPTGYSISDTSLCSKNELTWTGRLFCTSFQWDDGSTAPTRSIVDSGTYWVRSFDGNNCKYYVDTIKVAGRREMLPIRLGNDTLVCAGEPIILDARHDGFTHYTWNTGSPSGAIAPDRAGTYTVYAYSDCYWGTDTIQLLEPAHPLAALPDDIVVCGGIPVSLRNIQQNMDFSWNTGEDDCCIVVNTSGNYELTVTNICGEQSFDRVKVTFTNCEDCLYVPTAFSPNNDGLNDLFEVKVPCLMKSYDLKIYNRWGQLVYQSLQPQDLWDGTFNGKPVAAGVYFYSITAQTELDAPGTILKKGDITLIR